MPFERRLLDSAQVEAESVDSDSETNLIPLFAEEDESSDYFTQPANVQYPSDDCTEVTLDNFRKEWKSELDCRLKESIKLSDKTETAHEQQLHDVATKLFLEGVDCERRGDMWEAVQRYMGAVHMVPDIELKVYKNRSSSVPQNFSENDLHSVDCKDHQRACSRSGFGARDVGNLGSVLKQRINATGKYFEPEFPDEPCPIALLPVELLSILMRYVVGTELDIWCLEQLSLTSAGFYLLSRDEDLWHAVCRRTFGIERTDSVTSDTFDSWRHMYIKYPHVKLNGVYIGKTTYLRNGEASFQDQFYKPWHIIVYYRMLKFFADGTVIMLTTSDTPAQLVESLKSKSPRIPGIFIGRYWMTEENRILAKICRRPDKPVQRLRRTHRTRQQFIPHEVVDQKFDMKLRFGDGKKRRPHSILHLEEYNCTVTYLDGKVSQSSLNANDHQAYPPLIFSRVNSYSIPDGWDEILI